MPLGKSQDNTNFDNDGRIILTGSANAYVAQTARNITGYYRGLRICARANFTNTGAATIKIDKAPAIDIRKAGNAALVAGNIVNGTYYDFIYDDANGVMQIGSDGALSGPASSTDGDIALFDGTGGKALKDSGKTLTTVGTGKQTIWIPATAMLNVGTAAFSTITFGTLTIPYFAFDASSEEFVHAVIAMPKGWDEGNVSAQFYWLHPATTTNFGVVWRCLMLAFGDGDAFTGTGYGGVSSLADTGGTTSDLYISPESSSVGIGGSPAEGDLVQLRIGRLATDASDTLAVDAYLIGMKLFYTTNANTDN